MWTIGITRTGNEVGLRREELDALPDAEQQSLICRAAHRLDAVGAHYTAESLADCDLLLNDIERRLAAGERP
jgi:phosphonoacetaldehyde hydrolase